MVFTDVASWCRMEQNPNVHVHTSNNYHLKKCYPLWLSLLHHFWSAWLASSCEQATVLLKAQTKEPNKLRRPWAAWRDTDGTINLTIIKQMAHIQGLHLFLKNDLHINGIHLEDAALVQMRLHDVMTPEWILIRICTRCVWQQLDINILREHIYTGCCKTLRLNAKVSPAIIIKQITVSSLFFYYLVFTSYIQVLQCPFSRNFV